ncbi:MAG: argininosuccinate lyase [Planctomycetota bacterium]|nr:argininosuccinate lyase [Planctomycetota bacterium]
MPAKPRESKRTSKLRVAQPARPAAKRTASPDKPRTATNPSPRGSSSADRPASASGGAMWGGRFEGEADPLFRAFNDSLPFDYRLTPQDIEGSIAWAEALGSAGVLTQREVRELHRELRALASRVSEHPRLPLESSAEDVHSWVEQQLVAALGPLGKKLHTGRSRNDQVATDLRLWVRAAIDARRQEIAGLRAALVKLASQHAQTVFPGYTHVQRAQPIVFGHWCLAYAQMLSRDDARFADARGRVNVCPLGSAALAGTTYEIDREKLARALGFESASENSLDATADRDFVAETLAVCALAAMHLSRMAEDLVLYASQEFALVDMHDSVSSGSSLMPQKKNPDAAELIRGKCGRIIGSLAGLLTTLKGLPLAYNKDLQEDKEPVFDAMDQLSMCLRIATRVISTLGVRAEAALAAAKGGYSNATELADYFVAGGVPFRDAHDIVGKLVREAIERGVALEELELASFQRHWPAATPEVYRWLDVKAGLKRREILGGTGPNAVRAAAKRAAR